MTNNNYTKYSGFSKPQEAPAAPEVKNEEVTVTSPTEDPVVAPEDPVTPEPPVEDNAVIGVVTNCVKLNVRKAPEADAEVLTTIPLAAEVKVDIEGSVNGFYKVCTGAGVEGYCKEDFININ